MEEYLHKKYDDYLLKPFQFGSYYTFLKNIVSDTKQEDFFEVTRYLNCFFLCSNILDDIMDEDNDEINNIYNLHEDFPMYLDDLLTSIGKVLTTKDYLFFMDYISKSLLYQIIESKSQLCANTTLDDYFSCYVKRSVYFLQAAVPYSTYYDLKSLYTATKYFAYFSQIKNDIDDLRGQKSSDLLNNRPTFPLILAIQYAVAEKNNDMIKLILDINDENYTYSSHQRIIHFINENDILEYAAKIALHYFEKSQKEFTLQFPEKQAVINTFFRNLIITEV